MSQIRLALALLLAGCSGEGFSSPSSYVPPLSACQWVAMPELASVVPEGECWRVAAQGVVMLTSGDPDANACQAERSWCVTGKPGDTITPHYDYWSSERTGAFRVDVWDCAALTTACDAP